jgi:threonine efflux protein
MGSARRRRSLNSPQPFLNTAAWLRHPGYFAHVDPPTPWVAWAVELWAAALNQNLLHPDAGPAARGLETRADAAHAALSFGGAYLAAPSVGLLGSHGAAALPLLATLLSWGRRGTAARIERCMELAALVEQQPALELWGQATTGVVVWRPRQVDRAASASASRAQSSRWLRLAASSGCARSRPTRSPTRTASSRQCSKRQMRARSRDDGDQVLLMSPGASLLSLAAVHVVAMASPGPNVLLVTQTAMSRSREAALAVATGIASGALILATIATLGLSLVLEELSWLHVVLRVVGGGYLIFLGVQTWRRAREPVEAAPPGPRLDLVRNYARGLLTNLTNPKAAVFFGSILVTVIRPELPLWVKIAAVAIVAFNATWWHTLLALVFARPRIQRRYLRAKVAIDWVVGIGLTGLGARLAVTR